MSEEAQSPKERSEPPEDGTQESAPQVQLEPEPPSTPTQQPATDVEPLKGVQIKMNPFERSTLLWTKATFFILAFTCIFIGFQWSEMRSGSADTHALAVAAGKQADTSKVIASAAQTAIESNENHFRLEERPYVTVTALEQKQPVVVGKNAIFLRLYNSGKTPALKITTTIFVTSGGKPITLTNPGRVEEAILPAGRENTHGYTLTLNQLDASAILAGNSALVFRAMTTYADIFNQRHVTAFCGEYDPTSVSFKFCPNGNAVE